MFAVAIHIRRQTEYLDMPREHIGVRLRNWEMQKYDIWQVGFSGRLLRMQHDTGMALKIVINHLVILFEHCHKHHIRVLANC